MVPEGDFEVGRGRGRGYIERGYSIQSLKGGKGDTWSSGVSGSAMNYESWLQRNVETASHDDK